MWQRFLGLFSKDIAMDLGTANTLLYTRDGGIVVNEPSVVALDAQTREVLAVGAEAKRARGRTPGRIRTVRPMKDGVVADFDVASLMVVSFIRKAIGRLGLVKPSMVICVPTGITQVEKKAVIDAALSAGAVKVSLIEEPMAAAIGAGLPVTEPKGSLVADIGGGTSEVAVITLSAVTVSQSLRVAGDRMNELVLRMLRERYRLNVGENTAERIKIAIGSAMPVPGLEDMQVAGKDLVAGVPRTFTVKAEDVREALAEPVEEIAGAVMRTLERTPPELAADIYSNGFCLAGGGALLRGLAELLCERTKLRVFLAEDPLTAVLRGTAKAMLNRQAYQDVFIA
ncbi:MAG: rod shape-determining protein [Desulfovibrio sp.]|nr:rod shape-determining protein [Desulfovibrio sp.]